MIHSTSCGKRVKITYNNKKNMYTGEFIDCNGLPIIYGDTIAEIEEQVEEIERELCRNQTS